MPLIFGPRTSLKSTVNAVLSKAVYSALAVALFALGFALLVLRDVIKAKQEWSSKRKPALQPKSTPEPSPESEPEIPLSRTLATKSINPQSQSPLFNLPPEIRNRIFAFACTSYETTPYSPNDWVYRPGYHAHRVISTSILETCRRAYLETFLLPIQQNEHVFWGYSDRGPPSRHFGDKIFKRTDLRAFFEFLTPEQRSGVQQIHVFCQQVFLENLDLSNANFAMKKLKITIRHQDWWLWEHGEPLGIYPAWEGRTEGDLMDSVINGTGEIEFSLPLEADQYDGWGGQLKAIEGLEEFELELETLIDNKDQMDRIVAFAKEWEFPYRDEGIFAFHEESGVKTSTWMGSKLLRNEHDNGDYEFDDLYEPEMDDIEVDDEDPAYDSISTYEYSDYAVDAADAADTEALNALETSLEVLGEEDSERAEHSYISPEPSVLEEATSPASLEQPPIEQDASSETSSVFSDAEDTTEAPAFYAPPHIIDEDENDDVEDRSTESEDEAEMSQSQSSPAQAQASTGPLLLESNEQGYYVVSMIFRKRLTDVLTLRGLSGFGV